LLDVVLDIGSGHRRGVETEDNERDSGRGGSGREPVGSVGGPGNTLRTKSGVQSSGNTILGDKVGDRSSVGERDGHIQLSAMTLARGRCANQSSRRAVAHITSSNLALATVEISLRSDANTVARGGGCHTSQSIVATCAGLFGVGVNDGGADTKGDTIQVAARGHSGVDRVTIPRGNQGNGGAGAGQERTFANATTISRSDNGSDRILHASVRDTKLDTTAINRCGGGGRNTVRNGTATESAGSNTSCVDSGGARALASLAGR